MADSKDRIVTALEAAAERIIDAVAQSFATSATAQASTAAGGAGQSTVGAQAGAGGSGSNTGQSTQGAAGEVKTKDDVAAPEVIEAFNVQALKDTVIANKALVDSQGARFASNAKLFDITATALGMLTMGSTHNMGLQQQMASDHRDQNHDRQINVNETDAYSVLGLATLVERLRNPTPVEE